MMPLYTAQPVQRQSFLFNESHGSESLDFASFSEKIKAAFQGADAPRNNKKNFDISDVTLSNTFASIEPIEPIEPIAAPESDTYIELKPSDANSAEATLNIDTKLRDSQLRQFEAEDDKAEKVSEYATPFAELPRVRYLAHAFTLARDAFDKVYLSSYRLRLQECCSERDTIAAKAERLTAKLVQREQQISKQKEQIAGLLAKLSESSNIQEMQQPPIKQIVQNPPVSKDVLETLNKIPESVDDFNIKEQTREKEEYNENVKVDDVELLQAEKSVHNSEDDFIGGQVDTTNQNNEIIALNEEPMTEKHFVEHELEKEKEELIEEKEQVTAPELGTEKNITDEFAYHQSQNLETKIVEDKNKIADVEEERMGRDGEQREEMGNAKKEIEKEKEENEEKEETKMEEEERGERGETRKEGKEGKEERGETRKEEKEDEEKEKEGIIIEQKHKSKRGKRKRSSRRRSSTSSSGNTVNKSVENAKKSEHSNDSEKHTEQLNDEVADNNSESTQTALKGTPEKEEQAGPRRKRYKTIRIKINPERDNENSSAKSQLLVIRNN